MPVEINPEGVKAEYRDGILALYLAARREREAEIDQGGVTAHEQATEQERDDHG